MLAVIDYKAGNLTSVMKALNSLGADDAVITANPDDLSHADRIILPGVGHFAATRLLAQTGLAQASAEAITRGTPFLGICVGMQWLFEGSTEAPEVPGLGLLPGACNRFSPQVKSPHVGWNSLDIAPSSHLFRNVPSGAFAYFTHSYHAPFSNASVATSEYGGTFSAAIERHNLMAVQFHPEKSGAAGLQVLSNFLAC